MGIGIALASGFVKERLAMGAEKRAAQAKAAEEAQSLITFQKQQEIESGFRTTEAVAAATVAGDKSITAAERTAASKKLENQTKIFNDLPDHSKAPFLEANPDFASAMGITMGTGDANSIANMFDDIDNTTPLGTYRLPLAQVSMGKSEDVYKGVRDLEVYLAQNPSFYNDLTGEGASVAGANNLNAARAYFGSLFEAYNISYNADNTKVGTDGTTSDPKYYDWEKGKLKNFYGLVKKLGIVDTSGGYKPALNMGEDKEETVTIPMNSDDDESVTAAKVKIPDLVAEYSTTPENLTNMASYWGMPQGQGQLYSNLDTLTYGEDAETSAGVMLADESKMMAVATGSLLVAANTKDMFGLNQGASRSVVEETTRILTNAGGGNPSENYADEDIGAMRRAVFTITKPAPQFIGQPPNATSGISGVEYANANKYDVKGHREQSSATDESVEMLLELRRVQADIGTTGLTAKIEKFALGVVGQFKDAKSVFMAGDPENDLFTQNLYADEDGGNATTASILYKTAEGVLGSERMKKLSKIDALRLTLAAKMARAVDPSGRLSNQDFEIQLERLGGTGLFTSVEGNLEKLDTVIEEFKRRQASQQDLTNILDKETITVEDRRFIKASGVVRQVLAHRRKTQNRQEVAAATSDDSAGVGEGRKLAGVEFIGPDGTVINAFTDGKEVFSDPEGTINISKIYDAAQEKGSN